MIRINFDGESIVIGPVIYLDELKKELILRKYSQRTIKLYLYHNREFLEFFKKILMKCQTKI